MSRHGGFTRAASSIANDVRLRRGAFPGAFLIVEGGTDARALSGFVHPALCQVVVADTRANVFEVIPTLRAEGMLGVVGLVDADFGRITGRIGSDADIVTTDLHDLEMTFVRSEAFDRVLGLHGSISKTADARARLGPDLRPLVIESAIHVGALRLHNERNGLGLRFEGLTWRKFASRLTLEVNDSDLCREVANKSNRHGLDLGDLAAEVQHVLDEGHDVWQLCNGHDAVEALTLSLRSVLGTRGPSSLSSSRVAMDLALAYPKLAFDGSSVAADIRDWESRSHPFRILA